jgi:hypothetical protein
VEQVGVHRIPLDREERVDVCLILRSPGRGVHQRLELEPDEGLGVDHRHAEPCAAQEHRTCSTEHIAGSFSPCVDEVDG